MAEKSQSITKLSELIVGQLYHMTADDVDCTIEVIRAGPAPLCIVSGEFNDSRLTNYLDHPPTLMNLVGWSPTTYQGGGDSPHPSTCFVLDEYPAWGGWLIGAWFSSDSDKRLEHIACDPEIMETHVEPDATMPEDKKVTGHDRDGASRSDVEPPF